MAEAQLFCFTYAGGSAAFYDEIEKELPELELVKAEYAGHGARHGEPFYGSFDEMADDMLRVLKKRYSSGIYALFGYSMGAITLAEVMRRIAAEPELPLPKQVFLAAHEPQTKAELKGFSPAEIDEWVKERTIQFGAVPERLINNKVFWRTYLPLYRADYTLISNYRFEDLNLRTEVPAVVFYSETDTSYEDMKHWKKYFAGACEFFRYEGKHFFIEQHHSEMAEIIRSKMNPAAGDHTDDI